MSTTMQDFRDCLKSIQSIELLEERIACLEERIGYSAPRLTGMPTARGSNDAFAEGMDKLAALRDEWKAELAAYAARVWEVSKAIASIPDETQREIMQLRYIDGYGWKEIAAKMVYSERRCYEFHQAAHDLLFQKVRSPSQS